MKTTMQIFLSYAREDKEKVENLYQKLSEAGFTPWMDKEDILPGELWQSCIQKAIKHSDFFLACLSANSVNRRGTLQREIKDALDTWQEMLEDDIYLIPVRLEDCEVPESLRKFQWVNLFEEDGWSRLVKAIQGGRERRKEPTSGKEIAEPEPKEGPERAQKSQATTSDVVEETPTPGEKSRSTITWLHLSDLHFCATQTYDSNIVLKALLRDITERIRDDHLQPDFIILSGDIAFASCLEEYVLAQQFLDDLLKTTNLSKKCLFLVPGNHDVDQSVISPLAAGATAILNNRDAVNRSVAVQNCLGEAHRPSNRLRKPPLEDQDSCEPRPEQMVSRS